MFCVRKSGRAVKYVLLSFLCFNFVFTSPTKIAYRLDDDKDIYNIEGEDNYSSDEGEDNYSSDDGEDNYDDKILHFEFFEFTTRKRYIWEDWTHPTIDIDYDSNNSSDNFSFFLYVVCPLMGIGIGGFLLWICIQYMKENGCCSEESDSGSSDRFTTVHPPPSTRVHRPRGGTPARVHRPQTGGTPVRVYRPWTVTDSEVPTSFTNPTYASSRPNNTVGEKPPEYSAVTLSDLINPTQPAFPVVHKESETPPPEYGKGDMFSSNKLP